MLAVGPFVFSWSGVRVIEVRLRSTMSDSDHALLHGRQGVVVAACEMQHICSFLCRMIRVLRDDALRLLPPTEDKNLLESSFFES